MDVNPYKSFSQAVSSALHYATDPEIQEEIKSIKRLGESHYKACLTRQEELPDHTKHAVWIIHHHHRKSPKEIIEEREKRVNAMIIIITAIILALLFIFYLS